MNMSALPLRFARWVLVWFGLTLGVAVVGPSPTASTAEPICTSAGMVWMNPLADDSSSPADPAKASGLHCILCTPALPFSGFEPRLGQQPAPVRMALHPPDRLVMAWHSGAPLPSRGPPLI